VSEESAPRIEASLHVPQVSLQTTRPQWAALVQWGRSLEAQRLRSGFKYGSIGCCCVYIYYLVDECDFRAMRPLRSPASAASAWWRYTLAAVRAQQRRERPYQWAWGPMKQMIVKRKAYIALYSRLLQGEELAGTDLQRLESLQHLLSADDLIL
jgi:hypothetical protein